MADLPFLHQNEKRGRLKGRIVQIETVPATRWASSERLLVVSKSR